MFFSLIISSVLLLTVNCQRSRLLDDIERNLPNIHSILQDNVNDTTQLNVKISLINILDFDYQRQEMELVAWLQMEWNDSRFRWSPKEYGNISTVRLNPDHIIKPDMKLYNGEMKIAEDCMVVASSDGNLMYIPPVHIKAHCPQKHQHPEQISCTLKFGSWVYDCHQLQLKSLSKTADLSGFKPGWRWNVKKATTKVDVTHYSCCPEPYCDLKLDLKVQDKGKSSSWF